MVEFETRMNGFGGKTEAKALKIMYRLARSVLVWTDGEGNEEKELRTQHVEHYSPNIFDPEFHQKVKKEKIEKEKREAEDEDSEGFGFETHLTRSANLQSIPATSSSIPVITSTISPIPVTTVPNPAGTTKSGWLCLPCVS
ncbi:unnamed protein product [Arabidopsis halleri]